MKEDPSIQDALALAEALGWNGEALTQLLENPMLQEEVLQLCAIGSDLRDITIPSEAFEGRVVAALKSEGMGSTSRNPAPRPESVTSTQVLGVAGAAVAAATTTVLALMTTGSMNAQPVGLLTVSLLVGVAVALLELVDLRRGGRASALRDSMR